MASTLIRTALLPTTSILARSTLRTTTRALSSSATSRQATTPPSPNTNNSGEDNDTTASDVPPLRLSQEQRALLEEMIRVDQAGELGANWIYRGQYAVLGSDKKVGPLLQVR
ncbi:hypothetical protein EDD21DRAFT_56957 [Dissophora ornata]|nr:hypothetical protein EDD21DRAFT_56957 [Dissophora ornata]